MTGGRPVGAAADDEGADAFGDTAPETYFASSDEWFRRYWRPAFRRRVSARGTGNGRWAPNWWDYGEALQRLNALWLAWETMRLDPGPGMSNWWIDHASPHMAALLSTDGCFAAASGENHSGELLPYTRPPAGLFPPDHFTDPEPDHGAPPDRDD